MPLSSGRGAEKIGAGDGIDEGADTDGGIKGGAKVSGRGLESFDVHVLCCYYSLYDFFSAVQGLSPKAHRYRFYAGEVGVLLMRRDNRLFVVMEEKWIL